MLYGSKCRVVERKIKQSMSIEYCGNENAYNMEEWSDERR